MTHASKSRSCLCKVATSFNQVWQSSASACKRSASQSMIFRKAITGPKLSRCCSSEGHPCLQTTVLCGARRIKMELTLLGSLPTSDFVCSIWCLDSVRSLTMHALSYATTSCVELADSRFESYSCYLPARVGLHALVFCATETSVGDLELFCCVFLLVLALESQL